MGDKIAVVCGGSKGIGKAIVDRLLEDAQYSVIYSVSRTKPNDKLLYSKAQKHSSEYIEISCDVESPEEVQSLCVSIQKRSQSVHLLVNTVGFLWNAQYMPEKNIRDVGLEQLLLSVQKNTWPSLSLIQNLLPVLRHKEELKIAFFSARVGSISDNNLGGWYSYRISKAALNMAMRNISIELSRRNPRLCCFGYHPGTVDTNLSRPFTKRYTKNPIFTPQQAAEFFCSVVQPRKPEENGLFFDWKGEVVEF